MKPKSSSSLNFEKLIWPITLESYFREFFPNKKFFVSRGSLDRCAELLDILYGLNIEKLTKIFQGQVGIYMPRKVRSKELWNRHGHTISPPEALKLYKKGASLIFSQIDKFIPRLSALCLRFASEIGLAPDQCHASLFFSPAGSEVMPHFDHEINMNLQLKGTKEWKIASNHHVAFPLHTYMPTASKDAAEKLNGQLIERYSGRKLPQNIVREPFQRFEVCPGDLVCVPQGFWHQTKVAVDSVAIDFVLNPQPWLTVLLNTIRIQLLQDEDYRKPQIPFPVFDWQIKQNKIIEKSLIKKLSTVMRRVAKRY